LDRAVFRLRDNTADFQRIEPWAAEYVKSKIAGSPERGRRQSVWIIVHERHEFVSGGARRLASFSPVSK
jgi:hypothetical protein